MLKNKKSIIVICLTALIFSMTSFVKPVKADDPHFEAVTSLYKGDKAPFDGILLSKDLAAKIEAEKKTMIELRLCEIKSTSELELSKSKCQHDLDVQASELRIDKEKFEQILEIKEKQLEFYRETNMPPSWYENPYFLISVGVISGAALTIGAIYASKAIND